MNANNRNGQGEDKAPLDRIARGVLDTWKEFYPVEASRLGMHERDGDLPRLDSESTDDLRSRLQTYRGALQDHPTDPLDPPENQLRHVLLWGIDSVLYDRVEDPAPRQNPLRYLRCVDWSRYVTWDYQPKEQRARALIDELRQLPSFLETARNRLDDEQHPHLVRKARKLIRGKLDYLREELSAWVRAGACETLREEFEKHRLEASRALEEFDRHLEDAPPAGEENMILGDSTLRRLLAMTERVDEPLDDLERAGVRERDRLRDRMETLLDEHDLEDPRQATELPTDGSSPPDQLIERARAGFDHLRDTLGSVDELPDPPGGELRIEPTPEHLRVGYFARLYPPGPFDDPSLAAYYYLTPPGPDWDDRKREEWQRFFHPRRLVLIAAHEYFPGHLLQWDRIRKIGPAPRTIFRSYGMVEGWAHYAEELALKHWPEPDPALRVAQLEEALVRVVRYLTSLRFHGGRCTLEEAASWFGEQAYLSPATALQEARRVLHDPGYLNYTLGKFQLRSLRASSGADSDAGFVDRLFEEGLVPPALVEKAWAPQTP